jgi:hypothetical protein
MHGPILGRDNAVMEAAAALEEHTIGRNIPQDILFNAVFAGAVRRAGHLSAERGHLRTAERSHS